MLAYICIYAIDCDLQLAISCSTRVTAVFTCAPNGVTNFVPVIRHFVSCLFHVSFMTSFFVTDSGSLVCQ